MSEFMPVLSDLILSFAVCLQIWRINALQKCIQEWDDKMRQKSWEINLYRPILKVQKSEQKKADEHDIRLEGNA